MSPRCSRSGRTATRAVDNRKRRLPVVRQRWQRRHHLDHQWAHHHHAGDRGGPTPTSTPPGRYEDHDEPIGLRLRPRPLHLQPVVRHLSTATEEASSARCPSPSPRPTGPVEPSSPSSFVTAAIRDSRISLIPCCAPVSRLDRGPGG